jgi:hypothetical protein
LLEQIEARGRADRAEQDPRVLRHDRQLAVGRLVQPRVPLLIQPLPPHPGPALAERVGVLDPRPVAERQVQEAPFSGASSAANGRSSRRAVSNCMVAPG